MSAGAACAAGSVGLRGPQLISVDEASGKISLSMKLASQGDGRDLDPSHAEAQAEGERGGGRGRRADPDTIREQKKNLTAMQVPEYGGKQRGGSEYALVPDVDDEAPSRAPAASGDGKYRLQMPGGGPPPPPPPPPPPSGRAPGAPGLSRQVELAAQLLAQAEGERGRRADPDTIREVERTVTGSCVTGESSTFLPSRLLAQEVATRVPS